MNKQVNNNHIDQTDDDRRLELMLSVCRPEPIDNTRIKNLVREKMMREQMVRASRMRRVVYSALSAAACLAILVVGAVKLIVPQQIDLSTATQAQVDKAGYKELIVAPGQRAELKLPDGSLLMANARSRVLYPEKFEGKERRIFACGEVYLEVAKDREHPFVVESDGFDVRVLGTVFNICNSNDTTAAVVLVDGSVEVTTDRGRTLKLSPDDMVNLVNGEVASLQKVDTDFYTAWTKGLMALSGESLSLLTQRLSDHYAVTISCADELSDVRVYGKLDLNGNLDQVLLTLSEIVPMEVVREGNRITMKSGAMK